MAALSASFHSGELKCLTGRAALHYRSGQIVFVQGDSADSIYFIQSGHVKATVFSSDGQEAIVALLGPGDFCGETCMFAPARRGATVTALAECTMIRLDKGTMMRALREDPLFAERFVLRLLGRKARVEEDLVDHFFHRSEQRLARLLLLLAKQGGEDGAPLLPIKLDQQTLAQMIGTTRSRISHFLNKFRRLGFIEYDGAIRVQGVLLNVVLQEPARAKSLARRDGARRAR